jgi:AraC family transcriptional regulator, transcriptional activator of pobA
MLPNINKYAILCWKEKPSPFVIKRLEEIRMNVATKPHRHSYYTIIWSFNKGGKHTVDQNTYDFEANTLWFVSPDQVHCIIPPQTQGIMMLFTTELLSTTSISLLNKLDLFKMKGQPLQISDEVSSILMNYSIAITNAFFSSHELRMDSIEALLKLFLIECNNIIINKNDAGAGVQSKIHPAITEFKKQVQLHLGDWHKVEQYTNSLRISKAYFSELFKQSTGETPKEYISNQIIAEAKRYALFTELSVKEIGFNLGFEDASQFSHFFKMQAGESFINFKESLS